MPVSIAVIVRRLFAALAVCAPLGALLWLTGLHELAAPFVLAAAIDCGLIVVSIAWGAIVHAHPHR